MARKMDLILLAVGIREQVRGPARAVWDAFEGKIPEPVDEVLELMADQLTTRWLNAEVSIPATPANYERIRRLVKSAAAGLFAEWGSRG